MCVYIHNGILYIANIVKYFTYVFLRSCYPLVHQIDLASGEI